VRTIAIYGGIVPSEVDGPGLRAVVHFAGCSIRCPGCVNVALQATTGHNVRNVEPGALASEMLACSPNVTISGGEPTDQLEGLVDLLVALRDGGARSVILFTGRVLEPGLAATFRALQLVDVVIDGPFDASQPEANWLRGSTNQRFHLLSDRIGIPSLRSHGVQVHVCDGTMVFTGFPTKMFLEKIGGE